MYAHVKLYVAVQYQAQLLVGNTSVPQQNLLALLCQTSEDLPSTCKPEVSCSVHLPNM